ncbi:hypothetical protein FN960_08610 [Alkalicoccobacillus porphyridii]|uniref:Uncharacterized protein n=2 Tax=Alkalicoccobacillus porphyridii TaxID=2597270 RepID=A0A554A0F8_9BACI|nr:hypothetical protein FN960_08610 [Alkalicoccobacillus porphyridii]
MILLFAQWCINFDLDPKVIYQKAFPGDIHNQKLIEAIDLTLPKEEADDVSLTSLLEVLSWFEQDQLAYIVMEEAQRLT